MTFAVGDIIHHNGEDGRFVVKKLRENGDLDCFGGLGYNPDQPDDQKCHKQYRAFRPSECRLAKVTRKLRVDDDE